MMAEDVTASYSLARHVVRGGLCLSPLPTQPSNDWKCTPSCRFASLHRREASRSAPYTQPAFAFSQHSPLLFPGTLPMPLFCCMFLFCCQFAVTNQRQRRPGNRLSKCRLS